MRQAVTAPQHHEEGERVPKNLREHFMPFFEGVREGFEGVWGGGVTGPVVAYPCSTFF